MIVRFSAKCKIHFSVLKRNHIKRKVYVLQVKTFYTYNINHSLYRTRCRRANFIQPGIRFFFPKAVDFHLKFIYNKIMNNMR